MRTFIIIAALAGTAWAQAPAKKSDNPADLPVNHWIGKLISKDDDEKFDAIVMLIYHRENAKGGLTGLAHLAKNDNNPAIRRTAALALQLISITDAAKPKTPTTKAPTKNEPPVEEPKTGAGTSRPDEDEATFEGKPVSYWLTGLRNPNSDHHFRSFRAVVVLRKVISKDAVPVMVAYLKSREEFSSSRSESIGALEEMGEFAKPAIPALAAIIANHKHVSQSHAIRAAQKLAPHAAGAVSALIAAMRSEEKSTAMEAMAALGAIGPEAKAAIPALTRAAKDADARYSKIASRALSQINPQP